MTASDIGAFSPAERRMLDILSRPEIGPQATLAALREAGLVPPAEGYEVRTLEQADIEIGIHDPLRVHPIPPELLHPPLVHLDPNTPFKTDGATGRSWIHATDAEITTGGYPTFPAQFKLPRHAQYSPSPYLVIVFLGRAAGQQFTATVDMKVYRGSVQIKATNNPVAMTLSTHARVPVKIPLTTVASGSLEGYGSVIIESIGESGFYWYGVDLRPSQGGFIGEADEAMGG
jgi:hypothetical protein